MEALHGSTRFEYELCGHDGDSMEIKLVNFGSPPKNEAERLKVVRKMWTHSQYCGSGDNTLEAIEAAQNCDVIQLSSETYREGEVIDTGTPNVGTLPDQLHS